MIPEIPFFSILAKAILKYKRDKNELKIASSGVKRESFGAKDFFFNLICSRRRLNIAHSFANRVLGLSSSLTSGLPGLLGDFSSSPVVEL